MKLITEVVDENAIEFITEENNGQKSHYIKGVFMQAEQKNRNGRIYPKSILEDEVMKLAIKIASKSFAASRNLFSSEMFLICGIFFS